MVLNIEPEMDGTLRAQARTPGRNSLWLIVRSGRSCTDVMTLESSGERVLPVFSFEEEAVSYVGIRDGWRIKEVGAGELVSLLYGPCRNVKRVILDPAPEIPATMVMAIVSVSRERYIDSLLAGNRRAHLFDGAHY